jgi:translation elongation factor EF-1beta
MSQVFFVWPHPGKSVSIAGNFNHWNPQPLQKQGNYWFGVFNLPDGIYQYKYIVDGRWVYDIGQINTDDGSGNWNNEIEVGKAGHKHPSQPISRPEVAKVQSSHQKPPKEVAASQQPQKGGAASQPEQDKPKSKKQLKREARQQQKEANKSAPPPQEAEAEPEPQVQPEGEPEVQPEAEAEAEVQPEVDAEVQPEAEAEVQPDADTPQVEQKKEKVLISIVTLEVVGQQGANMAEVEKFVRSIERPGLKWEGSSVKPHFFEMEKLEIICQARDDVAIDDDVCVAIAANEDLIAGASIVGFAC